MYPDKNRSYIHGMPIENPLYFFGLYSVINTILVDKIDLYASGGPSEFGGPISAVIYIKTKYAGKESVVITEISLLSANAIAQKTIMREVYDGEKIVVEETEYLIASESYGYLVHVLRSLQTHYYLNEIVSFSFGFKRAKSIF